MVRWLLTTTCIATALSASEATAAEQVFYDGPQWQVALVDTYATTGEAPYCAIRTTSWSSKQVSIEMPLQGVDQIGVAIRVRKDGWQLPIGETTEFGFVVGPLDTPFTAKAVDEDTLYTAFDPKAPTEGWVLFDRAIGSVFSDRKPFALKVAFRGSEQPWLVPSVDQFQAHQITSASRECQTALNHLGPSIYGAVPEADNTSPFGKPEQVPVPEGEAEGDFAVKVKRSSGLSMEEFNATSNVTIPQDWTFSVRGEDWGGTCVLETKKDNLSIGFMAAPGGDLVAFIDGLGLETATARWRANTLDAYEVEGSLNDSLGWLGFYLGATDLISELAVAEVLMVSVVGKSAYVLDVTGGRNSFEKFMACHSNNEHTPQAQSE